METALSRHMAGDPGASSQGGLGRVWGMDRVWQTLAVTVINAHEDVLVMWRTSIQGSPSWVLRRRTRFFFTYGSPGRTPMPVLASSAAGHSSDLMAGSRRLVSRGNRCRGVGTSSPDDSG